MGFLTTILLAPLTAPLQPYILLAKLALRLLLLPFTLLMLPILLPLWGLNALWKAFVFFIELPFLPVLIPYRILKSML